MVLRARPPNSTLSASERVVQGVADLTGTDPVELPRLNDTVDADALDALISTLDTGTVEFEYAGCHVVVQSNGTVHIPPESDNDGDPEPNTDNR